MLSIGEFSKATGLSVKTLRFYHERGILIPARVEAGSGYRYYDTSNLVVAQVIRTLRDFEFSLDEISQFLEECGDDQDLLDDLEAHRQKLKRRQAHYRDLVRRIDLVISQERNARKAMTMSELSFQIEERTIDSQLIAGIRMQGKYSDCGSGFSQAGRKLGRHIAGKAVMLCYDGEYREDDANFETCFPIRRRVDVNGINVQQLPKSHCATLVHKGSYETIHRSYARILDYCVKKGFKIELPTREVYLKGPGMIFKGNPDNYLTEIQIPIQGHGE